MFVGIWDSFRSRLVDGFVLGLLGVFIRGWVGAAQLPLGVVVAWAPNTDPDLAGYYIYYGPQSHVYTNRIMVGPTTTFARVEPLLPRGTYYMAITALNTEDIESFPSRELVYRVPNVRPTITPIDNQVLAEDVPTTSIHFTVSDLESPASALMVTAYSSNPALIPDENILALGSGPERNLIIVPQLDQSGSAQITLEVRDPDGGSNSVSFTVYVIPVNDDPLISAIPDQVINEDTASARLQFYVFDAETAPDDLWIVPVSSNPFLIPDENIIINGKGNSRSLTFRPAKNMSGSCVIDVFVIDEDGGYSWAEVNVAVRPVNDPPTISPLPNLVIDENSFSPVIPFTLADVDSPVSDLRLSASTSNPSLIGHDGIVISGINANRAMVIRPRPNQFGTASIQLVVTDSDGASSTNVFTVTVNPVNDPPNIDPIPSFSINEGSGPLTVPLTGINSGASNELQSLVVTAASSRPEIVPVPQVNYVSPNTVGSLLIAALPNTSGVAVITVSVSDGQATTSQSFTLSVQAINEPPVITSLPDMAVLRLPTPLRLPFNVQDPDTPADRLVLAAYSSDSFLLPAANLVLSGTGSQRTLTLYPVLGRTGLATVTILASDGNTASSTSFYILVTGVGL